MDAGDNNRTSVVEKATAILERDAFRCDGQIGYDRILALAQKLQLCADDLVALRQRLVELEISISGDPLRIIEPVDGADEKPFDSESSPPESVEDPAYQNAIASYLAETGEIELLTRDEEVEFMRRIRASELAAQRLAEDQEDHDGVLRAICEDGEVAREGFIEANLRLVVAMAKTTPRGEMAFEDLIQEGNFGLMKAVEKFDHTRGLRFSTYASWWIWAKMRHAVGDRGYLVRVPVYLRDRLKKLRRLELALAKERKGYTPTDSELAHHLGWEPEAIQFLHDLEVPPVSLDRNAQGDDEYEPLGSRLASRSAENPEQAAQRSEILSAIIHVIDGLKDRERLVMRMRFGLTDGEDHTLDEVADELGVTRQRVAQIQAAALSRIRHPARSKAIAELIDEKHHEDEPVEPDSEVDDG